MGPILLVFTASNPYFAGGGGGGGTVGSYRSTPGVEKSI